LPSALLKKRGTMTLRFSLVIASSLLLSSCAGSADLTVRDGSGPNPALPKPDKSLIPLINVVRAQGWAPDAKPVAASGLAVNSFARDLDHPRWLYVLPNGDVLVAETNAPPRPQDNKGIRGWFFKRNMKKAGGAAPTANRITLLRDADADGVAEVRTPFLTGLNSPFGMVLVGDSLYVANTDAIIRFPYKSGVTSISVAGTRLIELPAGDRNHHWTKNVIASADGSKLYVAVGSNSNVAEHGIQEEVDRAAIWEVDTSTGAHRVFATGLRNPVGMAWQNDTLWVAVNERDELGSDLVPDYITSVKDGAFYGWPYSYWGNHIDSRVRPERPDLAATAVRPDYGLGPHTASLGLAASNSSTLPDQFREGMFVGQHGSWNRKPQSGYRVIFVPFRDGKPSGMPVDVLTGFITENGDAFGRPVGVAMDRQGSLLVADDVGNAVWRVAGTATTTPRIR